MRVAKALRTLPRIDAAFARAQLSYSKVRAITRVADLSNEEVLLEVATHSTAAQLERICRQLRRVSTDPADHPARVEERRRVTVRYEDDGSVRVTAVLPPDEGARLVAAIESGRAAMDGACDVSAESRRADQPTESEHQD